MIVGGVGVGQRVMVVGGTRGLGALVARRFAGQGAAVAVLGRSVSDGTDLCLAINRTAHIPSVFRFLDVDQADSVHECAVAVIDMFEGKLDVLVNVVGAGDLVRDGVDGSIGEISRDVVSLFFNRAVLGAFATMKVCMEALSDGGVGRIVNVSSLAARVGVPGLAGYCTAKGALDSLSRQVDVEMAPRGVRCYSVGFGPLAREVAASEECACSRLTSLSKVARRIVSLANDDLPEYVDSIVAVD